MIVALLAAVLVAGGVMAIAWGLANRARSSQISLTRLLDLERADPTESPSRTAPP